MKRAELVKGKTKYKIRTENTSVFINCLKKNVDVVSVSIDDENAVCFCCFCQDETKAEKCINSCGCTIVNKKISPLVSFLGILKKRVGLVVGFVLALMLVYGSTFFVWDIRVKGNENLADKEIVEMLSRAGFEKGMLKRKSDVKKIVNKVLINEDELSWIAINFEGTVATAEVKESARPQKILKKENVNIVASNNGVIMRVDALDGDAQVGKGDTVTKGQLLISSFVKKRTGGSILKGAKGFVWAKTERHFKVVVPLEYSEKKYTGRTLKTGMLTFLGREIFAPALFLHPFENYDKEYALTSLRLSEKLVLPVEIEMCYVREYEPYLKRRTEKSALEIAKETAKENLYFTSKNFRIADIRDNFEIVDGCLVYECTFEGVENIAKELEFEVL